MPELPEVEIIKLFLAQNIVGLKVKTVEILNRKSFLGDPQLLIGKKIKSIERRAKVLIINFNQDRDASLAMTILIHLKMSGQLILKQKSKSKNKQSLPKGKKEFIGGHPTVDMHLEMPNKSTRVIFNFSNGSKLFFNDQRKFGWIKLVDNSQLRIDNFLQRVGPEPLEKKFSWQILKESLLRRRKTPVKVALLDQEIVAGIGNIYACEACFLAGIHPSKKISELNNKDFQKLHKGIIESLKNGIKFGGSSKTHFADPLGKKGLFLDYAYVYGREKLPCKKCKTPIEKIKLGGRGTYFCPSCQLA